MNILSLKRYYGVIAITNDNKLTNLINIVVNLMTIYLQPVLT